MSIVTCKMTLIIDRDDFDNRFKYTYNRISDFLNSIVKKVEETHRHYQIKLYSFQQMPNEYGDTQIVCNLQLTVDGELTELELKRALKTVFGDIRDFEFVFDCQYDNLDIVDCKLPVEKIRKVVKKQGDEVTEITEKNGKGRKLFILKE